jgi:hypothetical protein
MQSYTDFDWDRCPIDGQRNLRLQEQALTCTEGKKQDLKNKDFHTDDIDLVRLISIETK